MRRFCLKIDQQTKKGLEWGKNGTGSTEKSEHPGPFCQGKQQGKICIVGFFYHVVGGHI